MRLNGIVGRQKRKKLVAAKQNGLATVFGTRIIHLPLLFHIKRHAYIIIIYVEYTTTCVDTNNDTRQTIDSV